MPYLVHPDPYNPISGPNLVFICEEYVVNQDFYSHVACVGICVGYVANHDLLHPFQHLSLHQSRLHYPRNIHGNGKKMRKPQA